MVNNATAATRTEICGKGQHFTRARAEESCTVSPSTRHGRIRYFYSAHVDVVHIAVTTTGAAQIPRDPVALYRRPDAGTRISSAGRRRARPRHQMPQQRRGHGRRDEGVALPRL